MPKILQLLLVVDSVFWMNLFSFITFAYRIMNKLFKKKKKEKLHQ